MTESIVLHDVPVGIEPEIFDAPFDFQCLKCGETHENIRYGDTIE